MASLPGSGGTTTFTEGALSVSMRFDGEFTTSALSVTTRDGVTRESRTLWVQGPALLAVPIRARLVERGLDPATARFLVRVMAGLEDAPASWAKKR